MSNDNATPSPRVTAKEIGEIAFDQHGTMVPLSQAAIIKTVDPYLITLEPFDPAQMQAVERAIAKSDLHLTSSVDGEVISVRIPKVAP